MITYIIKFLKDVWNLLLGAIISLLPISYYIDILQRVEIYIGVIFLFGCVLFIKFSVSKYNTTIGILLLFSLSTNILLVLYLHRFNDENKMLFEANMFGGKPLFTNNRKFIKTSFTPEENYNIKERKDEIRITIKRNVKEKPPFLDFYSDDIDLNNLRKMDFYYYTSENIIVKLTWLPEDSNPISPKPENIYFKFLSKNSRKRLTLSKPIGKVEGFKLIIPFDGNPLDNNAEFNIKGIFALID